MAQRHLIGSIDLQEYSRIKDPVKHSLGFQFSLVGDNLYFIFVVEDLDGAKLWSRTIKKAMITVQPESRKLILHFGICKVSILNLPIMYWPTP